jgi:hypothetical protein
MLQITNTQAFHFEGLEVGQDWLEPSLSEEEEQQYIIDVVVPCCRYYYTPCSDE